MSRHSLFVGAITAMTIFSCRPPQLASEQEAKMSGEPLSVLIEKVIQGNVLGRRLSYPIGLVVGRNNSLYVSDNGNDRVVLFDSTFAPIREIGGQGQEFSQLSSPTYLALDNDLNLAVSEAGNRRVSIFDSRLNFGRVIEYFEQDIENRFGVPSGVAFGSYGEIWVADSEKSRVSQFDSFGALERQVGDFGASGGQLSSPQKLQRLKDDRLLVCDSGNRQLKFYDKYGNYVTRFSSEQFRSPVGASYGMGFIWIVDQVDGRVLLFTENGDYRFAIGPNLAGNGTPLQSPSDIVLLGSSRLAIADSGNDRILICRIEFEGE